MHRVDFLWDSFSDTRVGLNRLEKEINKHSITDDSTADEWARDRQIASSVRAGAAGITGEDLSTTENNHIV